MGLIHLKAWETFRLISDDCRLTRDGGGEYSQILPACRGRERQADSWRIIGRPEERLHTRLHRLRE